MTVGQTDGLEKHIEELEYENARLMKEEHERKECERRDWQLTEFTNISGFVLVYLAVVYLVLVFARVGVIAAASNGSNLVNLLLFVGFTLAKVFLYFFGVWMWILWVENIYREEIRDFIHILRRGRILQTLFPRMTFSRP